MAGRCQDKENESSAGEATVCFGWRLTLEQLALEASAYVVTRTIRLVRNRQAISHSLGTFNFAALPFELFEPVLSEIRLAAIHHASQSYFFVQPQECVCVSGGEMYMEALCNSPWRSSNSDAHSESDPLDVAHRRDSDEVMFTWLTKQGLAKYAPCISRHLKRPIPFNDGCLPCLQEWADTWTSVRWTRHLPRSSTKEVSNESETCTSLALLRLCLSKKLITDIL